MSEPGPPPDTTTHWRHRRGGFYFGRNWAVLQTFLWIGIGVYDVELIQALGVVVGASYGVSMTLILGYYGNTAVETHASRGMR